MADLLTSAWTLEMRVVQVLVGLLIAEAPMWLRRVTNKYYAPMYAPFLLDSLNKDLAIYYGEDFYGRGAELDELALKRIKKRLVTISFVSMLLSAVITPWFYGAVLAFVLVPASFAQFLLVMALYRAIRSYWSYRDFGAHGIATRATQGVLALTYFMYVGAATTLAFQAYEWARPFAVAGNWVGLLGAVSDLVFVKMALFGIAVAAASSFFADQLADPDLRKDQLETIRQRYANLRSIPASPRDVSENKPLAPAERAG